MTKNRNSEGLRFDVLQVAVSQVLLHGRPAGLMDRQAERREESFVGLRPPRNDKGTGFKGTGFDYVGMTGGRDLEIIVQSTGLNASEVEALREC